MVEFTLRGGVGSWVEAELDVKRSRFVCRIVRVSTEPAARNVIDAARKAHGDARHHCSAFVLGSGSAPDQVRRSNDDGEPSGTAGRPILDVLNGHNLIDCVAVVSRNGLVARERRELFRLSLPHADAGRVEAELRQHGVVVLGTDYGTSAVMSIAAVPDGEPALAALVAGATAGQRLLEPAGIEWVDADLRA